MQYPGTLRRIGLLVALVLALGSALGAVGCAQRAAEKPAAEETHSDSDGIPDAVEKELGVDPESTDSDLDGLSDYYEIMSQAEELDAEQPAGTSWRLFPQVKRAFAEEASTTVGATAATASVNATMTPGATSATDTPRPPSSAKHPASLPAADRPDWDKVVATHKGNLKAGGTVDAGDPWKRRLYYSLTTDDVRNLHARVAGSWSWSGSDVPTAKEYVAAIKKFMGDDATTTAPCVDEKSQGGGFTNADPDLGGTNPASAAAAQTAALLPYAQGGFAGYSYTAKIHTGLCDVDQDGVPNVYEAYGFTMDRDDRLPQGLGEWGFEVTGNAQYVVSTAAGGQGPFWAAWGVGGENEKDRSYPEIVIGSGITVKDVEKRDYTAEYFRTDPQTVNTDGDADLDSEEVQGDPETLASDARPWNTPAVGAAPNFRVEVSAVKVTPNAKNITMPQKPDWLDEVTGAISTAAPVVGQILGVAGEVLPLVAENGPASVPATARTVEPLVLPGEEFAYAAETAKKSSGMLTSMSKGLQKTPNMVGQVKSLLRLLFPKKPTPLDWTQVVLNDSNKPAGTATFTMTLSNDGRVDAWNVVPGFTVMLGETVVDSSSLAQTTLHRGEQGKKVTSHDINLTLPQLQAAMTGGSFSVIPNVSGGNLHKRVGSPLQDVDLGAWDGFRSDIDRECATLIFDAGEGYSAQYQVAATQQTTVRDAIYQCLRNVDRDGEFKGFKLPKAGGASGEATTFPDSDMKNWAVVFDARIDDEGTHYYWTDATKGHVNVSDPSYKSSMDVALAPRSIIHIIRKNRFNTGPVFAEATLNFGGLKPKSSGGLDHKSVRVALANRTECVSSIDVYWVPDGKTVTLDDAHRLSTNDDGVYTIDLGSYQPTGKEAVIGALRGFDSTLTTEPYPVAQPSNAPTILVGRVLNVATGDKSPVQYVLGHVGSGGTARWESVHNIASDGYAVDVALLSDGRAIASYSADSNRGEYRTGKLKWTCTQGGGLDWSIDWSGAHTFEDKWAVQSSIDMNESGLVVETHWDNLGTIWSRAGKLSSAGTVSWGPVKKIDAGVATGVAVDAKGKAVQVLSDGFMYKTWSYSGSTNLSKKTISWSGSKGTGDASTSYPDVAMNSADKFVYVFTDARNTGQARYRAGSLGSKNKLTWHSRHDLSGDSSVDVGIGLSDKGTAVIVGSTRGWDGWYRIGELGSTSVSFHGRHGLPGPNDWDAVAVDVVDGYK